MHEAEPTVVTLHLRHRRGHLSGRVRAGDGPEHPFHGWMGLMAAIDALLPACTDDRREEPHMATTDHPHVALDLGAAERPGLIIAPGEQGWDDARRAFNLLADQRPACIARPRDAAEVAHLVVAARRAGLRVAPQLTGHGATRLGSLERTMLMRTDGLDELRIDPAARTARVGAGVRWGAVSDAAAAHGLAALAGSSRDVGVVGYTLGGGLSFLGREHGLAVNAVTAVEMVLADGCLVRADHRNRPDLFWAVRGGGANLGAVSAIEFGLLPIAEVFAGALFFPIARASEVLCAWRDLTDTAPEALTTVGRMLRIPDMPGVPPPMAGRDFALVEAVFTGPPADGEALLAPFRALGPEIDTLATIPAVALGRLHMDPEDPMPFVSDHAMLGPLDAAAIDRLVAAAGADSGSRLVSVELRHAGGAFARRPEGAGAVATLPGSYVLFAGGVPMGPDGVAAVRRDLGAVRAALSGREAGLTPNFTEEGRTAADLFDPDTAARLSRVRGIHDPHGLFQPGHEVEVPR